VVTEREVVEATMYEAGPVGVLDVTGELEVTADVMKVVYAAEVVGARVLVVTGVLSETETLDTW
jgi:hypothetical protein